MEFSRIGEHTIKCVITEEEIYDLGFTMDEIMSNGERTQEFMNHIFDMAEQEFQTKFEMGIKTVRADFLPDHTLSLTFSEHPGSSGMMEHIKDIVGSLLGSIPKEKWSEIQQQQTMQTKEKPALEQKSTGLDVVVMFLFEEFDVLVRYAKLISLEKLPKSALYKNDGCYYLMMDMTNREEEEIQVLSALTDEYATDIFVETDRQAYVIEHGQVILKSHALEQLKQL